jgi:hypothetical protein
MIPTLQLDPSTLALWFNLDLLNSYRGEDRGLEVFTHGAAHDLNEVYPILDDAASDAHRSHYYEILSSVWHEKRHFLDFLLTNFGAFQVRTYFQMYFNLPFALQDVRRDIPLLLPLDSYSDPVNLFAQGIDAPPPPELLKMARWLGLRNQALTEDAATHDGILGTTEVGGIAQMEAIAYVCQLAVLQYEFGTDAMSVLNRHSPLPKLQSRRYAWARDFFMALPPHPDFPASAMLVNMDVMIAIMVAALCGRAFTLSDEPKIPSERTAPSLRLAQLYTAERWEHYAEASAEEVWTRVDAKANELWGFTIEEELQQDWEIESRLIEQWAVRDSDSSVFRAFQKYHATRRLIIDDFIASPARYTSTAGYWALLYEGVSPTLIVCSPSGQPCTSNQVDALFEYDATRLGSNPAFKGWHALIHPKSYESDGKIAFRPDDDWKAILAEFSPVTKLLVSGKNQRIMLGAELQAGERLLRKVGFQIRYVPPFDKPTDRINGDDFGHVTGRDQAICDFTGKAVSVEDFEFISPWEIRSDRGFLEYISERMGSQHMAAFTMVKDWSYWLTSKEHAKELRSRFGLA